MVQHIMISNVTKHEAAEMTETPFAEYVLFFGMYSWHGGFFCTQIRPGTDQGGKGMGYGFSGLDRTAWLEEMSGRKLDLLVIGGGITGAGIAWDASCRGMATGLLAMDDFASGASGGSAKLMHGGLHYLKQGGFRSVREAGLERKLLRRSAPHLVEPIPIFLPIYKKGAFGYWASSIGLYVHDWLAGVKRNERRKMYRRMDTIRFEPLFRTDGLIGSGSFHDYRTDEARLTIEVMKSAYACGAMLANYVQATELVYRGGRAAGVKAVDRISGEAYVILAKKIINAAGPWADEMLHKDHSLNRKPPFLNKEAFLVVDHGRLPIRQAAYAEVPGGRMIFAVPKGRKTYIGTIDTVYGKDLEQPDLTETDRSDLLDAVNHVFPEARLCLSDIEAGWAGYRPLAGEEGKRISDIPCGDELTVSDSGLIAVAEGKLAGFRKLAEKAVDLAAKQLQDEEGRIYPPCTTDRRTISGGLPENGEFTDYHVLTRSLVKKGRSLGIDVDGTFDLMSRYGSGTDEVFRYYSDTERDKPTGKRLLYAELQYCIHHEMTVTAADFLLRRTGWMLFDRKKAERFMQETLSVMARVLEWDREECVRQRNLLEQLTMQVWGESYRIPDEGGSGKKKQEERRKVGKARIYA